jgi:hypothetical protein
LNLNSDCTSLLAALGLTAADVMNGVAGQVPLDGTKSTIAQGAAGVWQAGETPADPYFANLAKLEYAKAVNQVFKEKPGLGAMSQLGGSDVYYRPGGWFSPAGYSLENIFHETLHNLGKTDPQIQSAWVLPVDQSNTKNISDLLVKKKCVK